MNPLTDRQIFEGEIATYWFNDDGFLVSLSKSVKRKIENITGNIALVRRIANSRTVALLIYLSNSPVSDRLKPPPIPMKNFSDDKEASKTMAPAVFVTWNKFPSVEDTR